MSPPKGHFWSDARLHTITHTLTQPWSVHSLFSSFCIFAHPIDQEPSLRLVPAKAPVKASISDTANSLGVHDTLKYGPRNLADEIKSTNPLQARLENVRHSMPCSIPLAKQGPCYQWDETQRSLKLTMHRNIYGLHAPMRQLMERKIVSHVGP